jgi:hypothetical protein
MEDVGAKAMRTVETLISAMMRTSTLKNQDKAMMAVDHLRAAREIIREIMGPKEPARAIPANNHWWVHSLDSARTPPTPANLVGDVFADNAAQASVMLYHEPWSVELGKDLSRPINYMIAPCAGCMLCGSGR